MRRIDYRGQNLETLATYLYANPGAKWKDAREAVLRARGIEPGSVSRGFYSYLFSHYSGPSKLWVSRDGGWHLTAKGLAKVR